MKYLANLISIACDLSEASLQQAWEELRKPDIIRCSLIIGTQQISAARIIRLQDKKLFLWVNAEWTTEWLLNTPNGKIFSEGC